MLSDGEFEKLMDELARLRGIEEQFEQAKRDAQAWAAQCDRFGEREVAYLKRLAEHGL